MLSWKDQSTGEKVELQPICRLRLGRHQFLRTTKVFCGSEHFYLQEHPNSMCEKSFQNPPVIIAIDGPAASGKSTIGNLIANKLGYISLDTGIMYRAVAFQALQEGVNVFDDDAVSTLAESC